MLFALYRLYLGDKIARFVVTFAVVTAIGLASYAAFKSFSMHVPAGIDRITSNASDGMARVQAHAAQNAKTTGATSSLFALYLSIGLVAIYLPASTQWLSTETNPTNNATE